MQPNLKSLNATSLGKNSNRARASTKPRSVLGLGREALDKFTPFAATTISKQNIILISSEIRDWTSEEDPAWHQLIIDFKVNTAPGVALKLWDTLSCELEGFIVSRYQEIAAELRETLSFNGAVELVPKFNAAEFCALGEEIAKTFPTEAGFRTAIGRVYYACHLVGIEAMTKKGWYQPTNAAKDHSGLFRAIGTHGGNLLQTSHKLRDLVELREHSDYHIDSRAHKGCKYCNDGASSLVDESKWQRALAIASDILPKLANINPSE